MNKYEELYGNVKSFLFVAQGFMVDLAEMFEEDENGHDQATVEDLKQELDSLMKSWEELPDNLIGGDIK